MAQESLEFTAILNDEMTAQLEEIFSSVEGLAEAFNAAAEEMAAGMSSVEESVSGAAGAMGDISGAADAAAGSLDALGGSADGAGGGLDMFSATAASTAESMAMMGASADEIDAMMASFGESADVASGGLDAAAGAADAAAGSFDALAGSVGGLDAVSVSADDLGTAANASTDAIAANTAALADNAAAATDDAAATDANTVSKQANDDANTKNAGSANKLNLLLLGAGAAVAVAGVAAVKAAGDFQAGITSLVTGAGEAQSNVKLVSDGILNMAQSTGESTSQLISGAYMIESAGYHGANALNVLQAAAEGAKVGNADLGTVADATTTILNDFGSTGITASGAVNELIATVASGKTHMQDLGQSLSQILPTASAAHVGLQDVMGAMATMTGEGVPAANAATYLRQTILALDAPSAAAQKALKNVGLSTDQVASMMQKSLPDTLAMITDAVGKKFPVGSAQYVAAIKDISGGSKTMQGMLDLTGDHMSTFTANVQGIGGAVKQGGNSIVGWSQVQGTFNQKLDEAGSTVETFFIRLGTQLLPVLGQLVDAFSSKVMPAIGNFTTFLEKNHTALALVAGVLGGVFLAALYSIAAPIAAAALAAAPLVLAFVGISAIVALVVTHWQNLVTIWNSSAPGMIAIKAVVLLLAGAFAGLGVSILVGAIPGIWASVVAFGAQAIAAGAAAIATLAAAAPFILIGAAIAAVIGIIILLVTHWKQVSAFLETVWKATVAGVEAGLRWLGNLFGSIFSAIGTTVRNAITAIGNFIKTGISLYIQIFELVWKTILTGVGNFFSMIGTAIQNGIKAVVQFFQDGVQMVVGWFQWLYNHNYYFKDLVDAIKNIISDVKNWLSNTWNTIVTDITNLWKALVSTAKMDWAFLTGVIQTELNNAKTLITNVWNTVVGFLSGIWNTITSAVSTAWDTVSTTISTKLNTAKTYVVTIGNNIITALENAWNTVKTDVTNAWNNFISAISGAVSGVASAIGNIVSTITTAITNLASDALQWGKNLIQQFINGITSAAGGVGNAISGVVGSVKSFLGFHSPAEQGPGADADTWAPNLVNMFAQGLISGTPKIANAAQQMAGALAGPLGMGGMGGGLSPSPLSVGGGYGYGGAAGATGLTVNVNLTGDLGAGLKLLNATDRLSLAQMVAQEMGHQVRMQVIDSRVGYAGH